MRRQRRHSIELKGLMDESYLAGASLHCLANQHDVCRNLIRVWVQKYEAGEFETSS